MGNFDLNIHFLHGFISLLFCIVLLPLFLSTSLSRSFSRSFQRNLGYLLVLDILWNILAFIEQLPPPFVSERARYAVYIIGGFCWIQFGYAIIRETAVLTEQKVGTFWKIWNLVGIVFIVITGLTGNFYTGIVNTWYGYTAINSFLANFAIIAFLVFPVVAAAIIVYRALRNRDSEAHFIYREIFAVLITAIIGGLIMDALLPAFGLFIYGESAAIFMFFVTLVFCQANLAISNNGAYLQQSTRSILQELEEGVIILNANKEIEMANAAASEILGLGEHALLHKPIDVLLPTLKNFMPSKDIPIFIRKNNETVSASASISSQTSYGFVHSYKILIRNSSKNEELQKKISALQSEISDERTTLRLKTADLQQLYKQQQIFLNSLLNNLPLRLWSKNLAGVYTQQNGNDIQVRGDQNSRIDSPEFTEDELSAMKTPGQTIIKNDTETGPDGKKLWSKKTTLPLYDENRRIKGVLGLIEDTTNFHALEEERNQLRDNLSQAAQFEDMSNVAGGLAHDFNNILAGIIGYCELAQMTIPDTPPCEKTKKYLENMRKSMGSAADLVQHTFNQLKQRQNEQKKTFSNFNVNLVFDEVKNSFLSTLPKGIQIIDNSIKNQTAFGDATDFQRIMMNLGKNAILAMAKKGGTLTYACEEKKVVRQIVTPYATIPPGNYLYISVTDTGDGMTPDIVKRIFTPFFTTRAQGQGMGIGLSVTMRLVKNAGAYISLRSIVGKGTIFELYWPPAKHLETK